MSSHFWGYVEKAWKLLKLCFIVLTASSVVYFFFFPKDVSRVADEFFYLLSRYSTYIRPQEFTLRKISVKPVRGKWKYVIAEDEYQMVRREGWLNNLPENSTILEQHEKKVSPSSDRVATWAAYLSSEWVMVNSFETVGTDSVPVAPEPPIELTPAELIKGVRRHRGPFTEHQITFADMETGEEFTLNEVNFIVDRNRSFKLSDSMYKVFMNTERWQVEVKEWAINGRKNYTFLYDPWK